MKVEPVTLEGKYVRLEPAIEKHIPDLVIASQSPEIWEYIPFAPYKSVEEWRAGFERWSVDVHTREQLSFALVPRESDRAIGLTGFNHIVKADRAAEIGPTWMNPRFWRTAINTESKYLLLRRAFETFGCARVQFQCDARNVRSQHAIERLGATKEAVLRKHLITHDGYLRDTYVYSIVETEWQEVKKRLENFLSR